MMADRNLDVRRALTELATLVRDKLQPLSGDQRISGETGGGDVMSFADQRAAREVRAWCERQRYFRCSLLLEETGTFEDIHPNPDILLVVDEIDGTRPFRAGMPTACVCVGPVPADEEPTLANVCCSAMAPFTGGVFSAVRGRGAWFNVGLLDRRSEPVPLRKAITFFEVVGAAPLPLVMALRPFWRSAPYGLMSLSSFSYAATRLALKQAHLYLHLIRELPCVFTKTSSMYAQQYGGIYPWDLAGPVPILEEAGCIVTTAHGARLDDLRLDDTRKESACSLVVSTDQELHAQALQALEWAWKEGFAKDEILASLV